MDFNTVTLTRLAPLEQNNNFTTTLSAGESVQSKLTMALGVANPSPGSQIAALQAFFARTVPPGKQVILTAHFRCELI